MPLDKLNINVRIGDKSFPMTIAPKDEQLLRQAAKEVSEMYKKYLNTISDPTDSMALVAFQFAKSNLELKGIDSESDIQKLEDLNNKILGSL